MLGIVALVAAVLVLAPMAVGQGFPFAFPIAPNGTPINNVPLTADTKGNVTWGLAPPSALSPGSAGQVLGTNFADSGTWIQPNAIDVVSAYSGIDPTGAADSTTGIQTAWNAIAGTGQAMFFRPGTYKIANGPIAPPNGKSIAIYAYGATWNLTGAGTGAPTTAGILATPTNSAFSTTLAASYTYGTSTYNQLSFTASPAIGSRVFINALPGTMNYGQQFLVKAVSGSGPFTVTVDRPILQSYANGTAVQGLSAIPQDITIAGLTMTGMLSRAFDVQQGLHVNLVDMKFTTGSGGYSVPVADPVVSFDISTLDSGCYRCACDFPSNLYCIGGESSEHITYEDVTQTNTGLGLFDVMNTEVRNTRVIAPTNFGIAAYALYIGTNGASQSIGTRVSGGYVAGGTSGGVFLDHTQSTRIESLQVGPGGSVPEVEVGAHSLDTKGDLFLTANSQTTTGLQVDTGSVDTALGLNVSNFVGTGPTFVTHADTTLTTYATSGASYDGFNEGGTLTIAQCDVTPLASGSSIGASASAGTTIITNCQVHFANASSLFVDDQNGGNTWVLDKVAADGANTGSATGVRFLTASTLQLGGEADLAALGTPLNLVGGSTKSPLFANGLDTLSAGPLPVGATHATSVPIGNTSVCSSIANAVTSSGTITDAVGATTVQSQGLSSGDFWAGGGAHPASTGLVRAANNVTAAAARNAANSADINVARTDSSNNLLFGDQTNAAGTYLLANSTIQVADATNGYAIAGSDMSALAFGGLSLGATAPFGAAYFGASTTSGLGYTEFAAATGTHNTQDAIVWNAATSGRISAYAGTVGISYTFSAAHHGFSYVCRASGRVVSLGSGTCSNAPIFWNGTTGTAADDTFRGVVSGQMHCTASGFCTHSGGGAIYLDVDIENGTVASGISNPTNPLIGWSASVSGLTVTLFSGIYNDACATPPVIDVFETCHIEDD